MKKSVILIFIIFAALFAQGEQEQYEMNLNLGNSDTANYTIVTGDCLWDLAEQYYQNPYEWRYIWQHNQYIADPHWIYPGNKLFIPAINSESVKLYDTAKTLVQISEEVKKTPTKEQLSLVEKFKYYFSLEAQRQAAFIYDYNSDNNIKILDYGEVTDGGKPLLVQHKNAEITIKNEDIKVGDRLDFYEIRKNLPVKNIKGSVIEPVASGIIKFIDGENATVFVDNVWGLLAVGAKVAPIKTYKSLGDELAYKVLNDSLKSAVIARMAPDMALRAGETVFIDKGANEDVALGDHFVFYETGKKNKAKSIEPVAQGLVISAEKTTATIRITTARAYSASSSLTAVRQGKIVAK